MSSRLRRGFKTEANDLARSLRRELGVESHAALNPWELAEVLGVPILALSELGSTAPDGVDYLLRVEPGAFSAVTVFRGSRRTVVHNDNHPLGRQANNIAHELSHAILRHEPAAALDIIGCRDWNDVVEEEASWLGAALLISDEAALHIVRQGMTLPEAADAYGVSAPLVRMRINVTGARRRVERPHVAKLAVRPVGRVGRRAG